MNKLLYFLLFIYGTVVALLLIAIAFYTYLVVNDILKDNQVMPLNRGHTPVISPGT